MKKVLNYGSLNIDYVYRVDHIVEPGETISSEGFDIFAGGKGLNQSIAIARAGIAVYHAGIVGEDGQMLIDLCRSNGVHYEYIKTVTQKTGHAIIQVNKDGQNSILLFGGANKENTKTFVDSVLDDFSAGDMILLQNEINHIDYIIEQAYKKKMLIILNPSPFDKNIKGYNLSYVYCFIMNEIEGAQITGKNDPLEILSVMKREYPNAIVVLTLGEHGAMFQYQETFIRHGIYDVEAVDTTAAGDTFTGYFVASIINDACYQQALSVASKAASLAVTKNGAITSIPYLKDVMTKEFAFKNKEIF